MAVKIEIQAFSLACTKCDQYVMNPVTGSYSFVEGMGMPEVGDPIECDNGHKAKMPRW